MFDFREIIIVVLFNRTVQEIYIRATRFEGLGENIKGIVSIDVKNIIIKNIIQSIIDRPYYKV